MKKFFKDLGKNFKKIIKTKPNIESNSFNPLPIQEESLKNQTLLKEEEVTITEDDKLSFALFESGLAALTSEQKNKYKYFKLSKSKEKKYKGKRFSLFDDDTSTIKKNKEEEEDVENQNLDHIINNKDLKENSNKENDKFVIRKQRSKSCMIVKVK
eukprot:EC822794.1.p1 GENE.EC822794.1~~EC822794.1.p1  ORF type:complete len:156 (+),score=65.69 EC822794.1:63-530(+)